MTGDDAYREDGKEQALKAMLADLSVPDAEPGFYDRAIARAAQAGVARQRNLWLATGFGSAVAAGLAAWVVFGLLLTAPDPGGTTPDAGLPEVTMALAEPRRVNLVFSSAAALDPATLTLTLPEGIELEGFPGQREITWETSLTAGRNLLPLTLVATSPANGELVARIEHEQRDKVFRLRVGTT